MNLSTLHLRIGGMSCTHCENTIQKGLFALAGVKKVKASYGKGTAEVQYDAGIVTPQRIEKTIDKLGYTVISEEVANKVTVLRGAGLMLLVAALFLLMEVTGAVNYLVPSHLAQVGMGFGMLFVIGLITSVHCVAMCGGINLSQCVTDGKAYTGKGAALKPALLYNAGRVISYTVIGFAVGALGGAITFSPAVQGYIKLLAGVFMVIMGVNMLGIFPWLRRLNPRMPKFIASRVDTARWRAGSPLVVGLLNGFMPCGPLQAMQIYALSTGSAFAGGLSMLMFSLGTVPLMFGLGALSSILSRKFTRRMLLAGAVLVAVLGLSMLSQGFVLAQMPSFTASAQTATPEEYAAATADEAQIVNSVLESSRYPNITVRTGSPVRWEISASQDTINGCNNRMFIPEYGIEHTFTPGDNVIEFTPTKTGTFSYSCWMGMIRATITVVDADSDAVTGDTTPDPVTDPRLAFANAPVPADYSIPADSITVAEQTENEQGIPVQRVSITLTEDGFSPTVLVVEQGLDVEWTIVNTLEKQAELWVADYRAVLPLYAGENPLRFTPDIPFLFSNEEQTAYGYVMVVPDGEAVDLDAVRSEVQQVAVLYYPVAD